MAVGFHKVGAATLNDLLVNVLSLVLGLNSKSLFFVDLSPALLCCNGVD